jgi:LmbE family N-acetylglucosaminyl deacetylase
VPKQIGIQLEDGLLENLASPARPLVPLKTVVIVAHPAEETLSCGALLPRLTDLTIVHVTDGAPRAPADARRRGFGHWAEYARARRRELERAATIAGVPIPSLKSLGLPDQGAALTLATLTRAVLGFIAGADLVLTHAFEGRHPDIDAVAFAVAAARGRMRGRRPAAIEMPLYRQAQTGNGLARLRLTPAERARKARMLAEFVTQQETLLAFGVRDEFYRVAPERDFTQPPQEVQYSRIDCGMTGGRFAQLAMAARGELGLDIVRA